MPIQSLTNVQKSFIRLGRIKKGQKDPSAPGGMVDLDYFRMIFDPSVQDIDAEFRKVYGDKPTRINIRLAFQNISEVWDANYETYKKGGLIAKAGENENGLYWIYYRDPSTSEVLVRDGRAVGFNGENFMSKKIDIKEPIYSYKNNKNEDVPVFLEPVGRLNVVIPELATVGGKPRIGFFEFCPVSPRDIRTISAELAAVEFLAKGVGKSITGIPMVLTRREELVTKNIKGVLSKGPSWVVHIEVAGEWGGKALEAIELKALPGPADDDVFEGATSFVDDDEFPDYHPEPAAPPIPQPPHAPVDPPHTPHEVPAAFSAPSYRPYPPDVFKTKLNEIINGMPAAYAKANKPLVLTPPNIGNVLAKIIDGIFNGDKGVSRHIVCAWLIGTGSTKDMSPAQVRALFKVLEIKYDDQHTPEFDSAPSAVSMDEFRMALEQAKRELNAQPQEADQTPF